MATIHFTDITIRALKGSEKYETFFDTSTKGFGIRCGLNSKTFVIVRGKQRERVTIGKYPAMSLALARAEAKRLLAADPLPQDEHRTFKEARDTFLAENYVGKKSDHKYHLELIFKKHFADLDTLKIATVTDATVKAALDKIPGPSARLHAFRAMRTFLNWCAKPPRRYIPFSPLQGYETPGVIVSQGVV